jgi:hypothetical protein
LASGLLILGANGLANATAISFTATDLADVTVGEDLWEYSYTVTENTFAADTGFTIYFDLGLYDLLAPSPSAPNADWDVVTWDPDPSLPDDGAYDAYALVNNAFLSDMFTISFVWLGGVAGPGAQFFEVYDGLTWSVLEDGYTTSDTAPVPEPTTMLLSSLEVGVLGILMAERAW